MLWRLKRSEFEKQKGDKNKAALKAVVDSGEAPGILAYARQRDRLVRSRAARDLSGSRSLASLEANR